MYTDTTTKMEETEQQAVDRFVKAMLAKMELRKKKYKPFGWRDPEYRTILQLEDHLISEYDEWIGSKVGSENEAEELVDIAVTSFMLWDRRRLKED